MWPKHYPIIPYCHHEYIFYFVFYIFMLHYEFVMWERISDKGLQDCIIKTNDAPKHEPMQASEQDIPDKVLHDFIKIYISNTIKVKLRFIAQLLAFLFKLIRFIYDYSRFSKVGAFFPRNTHTPTHIHTLQIFLIQQLGFDYSFYTFRTIS